MTKKTHKIILFDGVCNLCNSSVQRVIRNDSKNRFCFAALQSEYGKDLAKKLHIDTTKIDSIVLVDNQQEKYWIKSSAILRIAKCMDGAYPILVIFLIVPSFLRNIVYDFIAKNRYLWYGKQEACMIPTPELKVKFLE